MRDFRRREFLAKSGSALAGLALAGTLRSAYGATAPVAGGGSPNSQQEVPLKRYVIEREIPSVGLSTAKQLAEAAAASDAALAKLAPRIQWEHSYVADNKTFCVYLAENEDDIYKHGQLSGFPVSKITLIDTIIDPTTANTVG